jgi:hypothetical protein
MPRVIKKERWLVRTGRREVETSFVAFCQERGLGVSPTGPDTLQTEWGNKLLKFLGGLGVLPGRLDVSIIGDESPVQVLARCSDNFGPQVLGPYRKRKYEEEFDAILRALKGRLDIAQRAEGVSPPAPPPAASVATDPMPPPAVPDAEPRPLDPGAPAASFCHRCGQGAKPSDAFCRACGANLAV